MPSISSVTDATFDLWQRLSNFPASETDAALRHLQEWIVETIDADNVVWIGGVRVMRGAAAKADSFLGWRLRARVALRPDPAPYRKQLAEYYDSEHYGKLTPTYYQRSHEAKDADHIGMDSRATMGSTGRFRFYRVHDGTFFDIAAFKKTPHYQRYYRDAGIADRIMVGFPVTADLESFFLIDRFQAKPRRRLFTRREAELAAHALRGLAQLHHRLLLGNGLLASDKLLSPLERQILRGLLTGQTEKQIALSIGRKPATLHKHVTALYTLFSVKSRQALMALWLDGSESELPRSKTSTV